MRGVAGIFVNEEICEIKNHINEKESTGKRWKKRGVRGEREKERERKKGGERRRGECGEMEGGREGEDK